MTPPSPRGTRTRRHSGASNGFASRLANPDILRKAVKTSQRSFVTRAFVWARQVCARLYPARERAHRVHHCTPLRRCVLTNSALLPALLVGLWRANLREASGGRLAAAMEITTVYQKERREFGRPVGHFATVSPVDLGGFDTAPTKREEYIERNPSSLAVQAVPEQSEHQVKPHPLAERVSLSLRTALAPPLLLHRRRRCHGLQQLSLLLPPPNAACRPTWVAVVLDV